MLLFGSLDPVDIISIIAALLVGLSVHEFAHAWVADRLGDSSAKQAGRLTLNPAAHLDPWGTIMVFVAGFGWGKPVPYNPNNLRDKKWGPVAIALSGPASNFLVAIIFGLFARAVVAGGVNVGVLGQFFLIGTLLNFALGIFNLIPIPPLDGSKLLRFVWPKSKSVALEELEKYGIAFLFGFVVLSNVLFTFTGISLTSWIFDIVLWLTKLVIGAF